MSNLKRRTNRILKVTHRFVPITAYRVLAESFRLRLEEAEKRPGLKQRLDEIRRLSREYAVSKDPKIQARIHAIFETDQEVWAANILPFWEAKSKRNMLGDWLPSEVATNILEIAKRAEGDLERRRNSSL